MNPTDEQYGDGVLEVARRGGELPATGIDLIDLLIVALCLLAAGGFLLRAARS